MINSESATWNYSGFRHGQSEAKYCKLLSTQNDCSERREAAQVTVGGKGKRAHRDSTEMSAELLRRPLGTKIVVLRLRKPKEAQDGKDTRGVKRGKMRRVLMGSADTLVEALRNH